MKTRPKLGDDEFSQRLMGLGERGFVWVIKGTLPIKKIILKQGFCVINQVLLMNIARYKGFKNAWYATYIIWIKVTREALKIICCFFLSLSLAWWYAPNSPWQP